MDRVTVKMKTYLVSLILLVFVNLSLSYGSMKFPLLMPDVQPTQPETYLCTAFKMPRYEHQYIVEFLPNATMNTAHHILVYGCEIPGYHERDTPRAVWDCGEMSHGNEEYRSAPTCASGSQIVYAWAMDAPKLTLPKGVGFKVGGETGVNYLVLQVHYAHVEKFMNGETDNSGIILSMLPSDTKMVNKRAGVLLLGTGGSIPAHQVEHMETSCEIDEPLVLHPFAFRTHTHKLGKAVAGYKIDHSTRSWSLVGKHDPQQPQMFYPAEKDLIVRQGDIMAARCTMDNFRDHDVGIGSTGNDEMCNFYMMYYVDGDKVFDKKYCFSPGPPFYYWATDNNLGIVSKGHFE